MTERDHGNASGESLSPERDLTAEQAEQIWEAVLALPRGGCLGAFLGRVGRPRDRFVQVSLPNIPRGEWEVQFVKNPHQARLRIRYSGQGEPVGFELDLTYQTMPQGKDGSKVIPKKSPLDKVRAIFGEKSDEGHLIQAEYEIDRTGQLILSPTGENKTLKKGLTFKQADELLLLLGAPSGS